MVSNIAHHTGTASVSFSACPIPSSEGVGQGPPQLSGDKHGDHGGAQHALCWAHNPTQLSLAPRSSWERLICLGPFPPGQSHAAGAGPWDLGTLSVPTCPWLVLVL